MKLKTQILGTQTSVVLIEMVDNDHHKSYFSQEESIIENETLGQMILCHQVADGILILDNTMLFSSPQRIQIEIIGEAIVMHFMRSGTAMMQMDTPEYEESMVENTHNIWYASNLNVTLTIPALQEVHYFWIVISPECYSMLINKDWSLHASFSSDIQQKKTAFLSPTAASFSSKIQWVIHEINNGTYEGMMKKMYLEAKIKELLLCQLDSLEQKNQVVGGTHEISDEDRQKLLEAKLILEENFTQAPSLAELSRLISLNEFKLKKGFKACFKTTIKSYVTQLRMEYAKELFKNETSNVGEVAYKCGYKDVSHFSAAFKFFYGLTPASFRKMNLGTKLYLLYWNFFDMLYVELLSMDYGLI